MRRILTAFGCIDGGQTSGAQRMAWRTTAALARRGHQTAVMTDAQLPAGGDAERWRRFETAGAAQTFAPDVVHAYDLAQPVVVQRAKELADRAGACFALTPASTPEWWPDIPAGERLCRQADVVYVLTATEAERIRALGVDPARMRRLPSAPDLVGRPDPAAFRARYPVSDRSVLFLGRRVAAKGYRTLLDAAPLVWAARPDVTFLFAGPYGEPAAAPAFRTVTDRRIVDLGVVDDQLKHDALAACDVFCLPTRADVFPLVFVEAWALGKPVVAGRFPGVGDVVRDGVDGLVVDHDPESVAAHLLDLLSDDAKRTALGRAGLLRVRAEMSWERVAEAVEAGYPGRCC
ncbi:glycosyltransferase family 4 protein [Micromonospora sp. CPCC 205539]|uniref:glycosyltransferase family 4 protein n=1 Tax=Micromonospora sp. CPCC 205539 TaxID=3122408 RepID=UPI002FF42FEE